MNILQPKVFPDNKWNVVQIMITAAEKAEKIEGKGENAVLTSIFSFSHNVFNGTLPRAGKTQDYLV